MNARPIPLFCVLAALALVGAPLPLTADAERIGQKTGQITELGQRLAPLNARTGAPDAAYWDAMKTVIEKSDAGADARADARSGHAGLMAHANDALAERALAPGVKCYDRGEPGRRAVLLFAYDAERSPALGPALLAFDAYAARYNAHALKSSALGETTCRALGE